MTVQIERQITPEWRSLVETRMKELNLTANGLARIIGTSQAAVQYVITRGNSSALVTRIDAALAAAQRDTIYPPEQAMIAEVAAMREALDAIQADIVRLEDVRARVEERIAEAYEHRARLDIRIRELRGGRVQ